MPEFSSKSRGKLETCDKRIQKVFNIVVAHFDCTILEGRRSKERQNELYHQGRSKLRWPASKHNVEEPGALSKAVDAAPYPIDWNDRERFYYFAGFVKGVAEFLNIQIRYGGDWDGDNDLKDNEFDDLVHFELLDD